MKIQKLFENFRNYINEASPPKIDQLDQHGLSILYSENQGVVQFELQQDRIGIIGKVSIKKSDRTVYQRDIYFITWSSVKSGYGPILYDAALAWVTKQKGLLMPDRSAVSFKAQRVWEFYMRNRPDVGFIQMDDNHNTLTQTDKDNFDQYTEKDPTALKKDPTSKAYYFKTMNFDIDKILNSKEREQGTAKDIAEKLRKAFKEMPEKEVFMATIKKYFPKYYNNQDLSNIYMELHDLLTGSSSQAHYSEETAYEIADEMKKEFKKMPSPQEFKQYFINYNGEEEFKEYGAQTYKRLKELFR